MPLSLDLKNASSFVSYNPKTGTFKWKRRDPALYNRLQSAVRFNNKFAGERADCVCSVSGYRRIKFCLNGDVTHIRAHRLAWFIETGFIPDQIDHINGDRSDNRFANLRNVSRVENARNTGLSRKNKTGFPGVSYCNTRNSWVAKGMLNGKRKHLGYFTSLSEAANARKQFEASLGYHVNHGSRNGWVRKDDDR